MGQTIGTIQAQNLSENEFSYDWHFCKVNFDFAYRSPTFGLTCKEFSHCHLEMKPDIIHRVLSFSMCGCNGYSGLKMTCSAVLINGKTVSCKSNEHKACLDLKPSMKIFEIHLSDPILSNCFNYIFKLKIKLHCYSTFLPSILNDNATLQNTQNKTVSFSAFNEVSTITKSLEHSTAAFSAVNEVSTSTKYLGHKTDSSATLYEEPINRKHLEHTGDCSATFNGKSINTQYFENNKAPSQDSRKGQNSVYTKELIEDLRCLYTSGDMCDLKIRIGEDIFRAHKLILCARSPVFKKMMKNDCFESSLNSVTITDCPALPFKKFLKYLYTGEIEDSTIDTVMSLYSLGHKYDVRALPEACSDILRNKLSSESVDNVANIICDVLQLAECHNDSKLQDFVASFIVQHFPVVSKKQSWKDLMKNNFELTSKILALVATGLQKLQS